jgi:hypothetical protein
MANSSNKKKDCSCVDEISREKCGGNNKDALLSIKYGPAKNCHGCKIDCKDDYIISENELKKRKEIHNNINTYFRTNGKTLSSKHQKNDELWFLPRSFIDTMNKHSVYKKFFIEVSIFDKYKNFNIDNILNNIKKTDIKAVIYGDSDNNATKWYCKYKSIDAYQYFSYYELYDGTRIPSGISDYVPIIFNKEHPKYYDIRTISDIQHLNDLSRTVIYNDKKKLIKFDKFIIYDDSIDY